MKNKFLSILFLAALTFCFGASKPNVVLIMADDVGCEPIGCYGGESFATPNVDALAATGMLFEHCYSMPVCHPSRIALMTGLYPFRLKAGWGSFPKAEEKNSIGSVMRRAGYATTVAGKWQMTLLKKDPGQPARTGFDEWLLFGWHEGARFHDPMLYQNDKPARTVTGKYGPDLYAEFLSSFMERSHKQGKPFFAYFPMALAHDVTDDLKWQVPYVPGKDRWMNYGEMIASMDETVGKLMATLDRLKLRENTIVFFTGDNGTASRSKLRHHGSKGRKYEYETVYSVQNGKRIRGGKGSLKDTGTHVPLIVNWPGKVRKSSVSLDLVDFSDWLPTLADLADTEPPSGITLDGHSFAPSFLGGKAPRRTFAFAEARGGQAFVRDQRWKLHSNGRLIDVANDPEEKNPIPKGKATEARQRLQAMLEKTGFGKR